MAPRTIFALSSGPGPSGVAVMRISGSRVRDIVQRLTGQDVPPARRAALRNLVDPHTGDTLDRGLVLFFPGPQSFTGEDVAELHLHGSLASIRGVSSALVRMPDVGPAEAGAFTERAFLNGKMDLIEVEALGDLLAAETLEQARFAFEGQQKLRAAAETWREQLLSLKALTEAVIDFSDEDDVARSIDSSAEHLRQSLQASLKAALSTLSLGERVRRGFRVALCGPPNAGKSSLLNALAQRDVAIVSAIPGTTRDPIEVHLDLGGWPVVLIDTAGLRLSDDEIEQQGMARAREAANTADLSLWLSAWDDPADCQVPGAVVVQTKRDLCPDPILQAETRFISVTTGAGIAELIEDIKTRAQAGLSGAKDGLVIAQARQAHILTSAADHLARAADYPTELMELRAEEIQLAILSLDRLTGRIDYEDVLGEIFSRFCIGK